jgi:hypothetical protein
MKTSRILLTGLLLSGVVTTPKAQTVSAYTLNWGTSFSPVWATGTVSRTASNIGGSGINCAVSMPVSGGGIFTTTYGSYGGVMTPTVASSTFIVPGSTSNLQVSLDYPSNKSYTTITLDFSARITNASFRIADIDRLTSTSINYFDQITITGYDDSISYKPVITKYDNSDPNFLVISGNNKVRVATTSGVAGNSYSDATDQRGTINVVFGTMPLKRIEIRYDNATGAQADPGVQNISVGNVSFQKSTLPVKLISFGATVKNGMNILDWTTVSEVDFDHFSLERSFNGHQFEEIARIISKGSLSATTPYQYTDAEPLPNRCYYRLKMTDRDGSFSYSKIVVAYNPKGEAGMFLFPTVINDQFTLAHTAHAAKQMTVSLLNVQGMTVVRKKFTVAKGFNQVIFEIPASLQNGIYHVAIDDGPANLRVIKQ